MTRRDFAKELNGKAEFWFAVIATSLEANGANLQTVYPEMKMGAIHALALVFAHEGIGVETKGDD